MIRVGEMEEGAIVKDLNSMIEFAQGGIVSKVFLNRPEANVTLFCMAKGQELSEHTSTRPANAATDVSAWTCSQSSCSFSHPCSHSWS